LSWGSARVGAPLRVAANPVCVSRLTEIETEVDIMARLLLLPALLVLCLVLGPSLPGDAQEPKKGLPPQFAALVKGSADEFIKQFDKKKQGYLTKEDMPPFLTQAFPKFDLNNDGKLDKKEVEAMLQVLRQRLATEGSGGLGKGMADFDVLDKKADGRITRDMVKGTAYEKIFDEIDTNKDGKLDRQEFEAYVKKQADKDKDKDKDKKADKDKKDKK
jgi:Ca2+-binding EF-hand superfamily protein